MNELPNGWLQIPLGEALQIQKGKKPIGLGSKGAGRTVPYINISAFETKQVEEYAPEQDVPRCQPSDTLLVWDGARAGLAGRGIGGFIGSTLARLTSDLADPTYLYYFVHSNYGYLNTHTKGVGIPHIDPVVLANIPFTLPPIFEQTRIVTKLEELLSDLDAGVAELKAAQKKLAQYRQSLLKAAVEGALTAEWRANNSPAETGAQLLERILQERRARWEAKQLAKFKEQGKAPPKDWQKKYPEPVQPDTTDLPELPQGWVWASLDQCALSESAITDGPFGSNLKSSHYQEYGPRVIRLQNIGDGIFIDAKAHISQEHYEELTKHAVETGDLIVAMLGEVLPRACTIPPGVSPAIVKADCARVRLNTDLVILHVAMLQLNSKPIRDIVLKFVKGIGRPRVNLSHIRAIPLAIAPMGEQREMARKLVEAGTSVEDQLDAITLSLKQSAAQRQNILKAAFSGQLVLQDPSDEPASELLARIRAERAAQQAVKKPRGRKAKEAA
jgi:type I restriction enzyme S subunit